VHTSDIGWTVLASVHPKAGLLPTQIWLRENRWVVPRLSPMQGINVQEALLWLSRDWAMQAPFGLKIAMD